MQRNPTPSDTTTRDESWRYPTPPAWADQARIDAKRAVPIGAPVRLVDLSLSFGAIFRLCLLVAISQAIIAGAVLAVYLIAINAT